MDSSTALTQTFSEAQSSLLLVSHAFTKEFANLPADTPNPAALQTRIANLNSKMSSLVTDTKDLLSTRDSTIKSTTSLLLQNYLLLNTLQDSLSGAANPFTTVLSQDNWHDVVRDVAVVCEGEEDLSGRVMEVATIKADEEAREEARGEANEEGEVTVVKVVAPASPHAAPHAAPGSPHHSSLSNVKGLPSLKTAPPPPAAPLPLPPPTLTPSTVSAAEFDALGITVKGRSKLSVLNGIITYLTSMHNQTMIYASKFGKTRANSYYTVADLDKAGYKCTGAVGQATLTCLVQLGRIDWNPKEDIISLLV